MHQLDQIDYLALRENCKVIEQDGFGDKVMILQDGTFLKLFRRKRLITSAAIWPYAQRFADNAKKLEELGIPCPKIIQVYRIPSIERDGVHYHPLPGTTLRDLYRGDLEYPADLRERFLKFVEHIQDLGVYFRSIHLGNVVLTPEDEIGLIDISDMKIFRRPLSQWQRKRNLVHMVKDGRDQEWLGKEFLSKLLTVKKNIANFKSLKKRTSSIAKKNNNNLYLKTLIKYDRSIAKIIDFKFVGFLHTHGKGEGALDTFRILKHNEKNLFEKTYRSDSIDLKNLLFYYHKIRKEIKDKNTIIPKIEEIIHGKKITIILFEKKTHIKITDTYRFLDITTSCIKELTCLKEKKTTSNIYSLRCHRKSIDFCKEKKLSLDPIFKACKTIEDLPLFFAHADLNLNNISADGTIYDWDSSGYLPAGYDLACVITESEVYKGNEIIEFIKTNHNEKYSIYEFTLSCLFLSFALTSTKKVNEKIYLYSILNNFLTDSPKIST